MKVGDKVIERYHLLYGEIESMNDSLTVARIKIDRNTMTRLKKEKSVIYDHLKQLRRLYYVDVCHLILDTPLSRSLYL